MPKSTENTVFVRFVPPPSQKLPRQKLESIFSEIGPVKKTAWIQSENNTSKGYGFVKYLSSEDAKTASTSLNGTKIEVDGSSYKILVELATLEPNHHQHGKSRQNEPTTDEGPSETEESVAEDLKKKSRIILRNLSFYAKENNIRSALEKKFGKIVDVHLPRVKDNLHVGFCFVTFADPEAAQQAVEAKNIDIHKRTVNMDWSVPKKVHQQAKNGEKVQKKELQNNEAQEKEDKESDDEGTSIEGDSSNVEEEEDDNDDQGGPMDEDRDEDQDSSEEESHASKEEDANALQEGRTVFLRNLPFDATRQDVFDLFKKFGYIQSIYLVKNRDTGMLKGTAFVSFSRPKSAEAAVEAASQSKEDPSNTSTNEATLSLKGRSLMVNMAVDKETADAFDSKDHNVPAADRRNMYLQAEARVESTPTDGSNIANTWDDIPEQDQKKRQNALKDKTTKLQSPLFFINPNRLSLRNLAKHVDEVQLRTLCEIATKKGLQLGLVSAKDYIAHLRAKGEQSSRDILAMVQEKNKSGESIIEPWEEDKKSKDYIPSVFIDREFSGSGAKSAAPSRGFGFVEFTHHVHALACLRELNNNPAYSREYSAGGKLALEAKRKGRKLGKAGEVKIPRLIVDFTVENRAKAKKQQERRLQQQLNNEKQRLEKVEGKSRSAGESKKRGRGALQRAKKKQKKADGNDTTSKASTSPQPRAVSKIDRSSKVDKKKDRKKKAETTPTSTKQSSAVKAQPASPKGDVVDSSAKKATITSKQKDKRWFE